MRRRVGAAACALALVTAVPADAWAVTLRVQVDQKGDFVVVGNTLGQDCGPTTPAPIVGTVGACGMFTDDDVADVFWRSDDPSLGEAMADTSVAVDQARSSAVLALPPGAMVTHAFLYWGAKYDLAADGDATFERPGSFSQNVTAAETFVDPEFPVYQSVADVTALVQQHGAGAYRVGGVGTVDLVDISDQVRFVAWSLVVFYELASEPPRNLALFDGLDKVNLPPGQSILLNGFVVPPNAAFDGKLGVIAYEGDNQGTGDQLLWDGNVLTDALNPSTNFFNSTRSFLGAPAYAAGDLPQLAGTAQSTSGIDLDVVDITAHLSPGQTSAVVQATTTGEIYWLGAMVTAVSTYAPELEGATKTAVDLNGGAVLVGDEIEYTIVVANTGSDAAVDTVLKDPLPSQTTLVPGSIEITQGPNAGTKTEATMDDQADYDAPTNTLVVRLGAGADATSGGTLAVGESTTVVFRVAIDPAATGTIENQASISAAGALGAPQGTTATDGNGGEMGSPPTMVVVDECGVDADCDPLEPTCDTTPSPNECVCVAAGREICGNAIDENCDGSLDDGCGGAGGGGAGGGGGAAGEGGQGGEPVGSGGNAVAASGAGGGSGLEPGKLEGGGCTCTAHGSRSKGESFGHLALAAMALAALLRLRKSR